MVVSQSSPYSGNLVQQNTREPVGVLERRHWLFLRQRLERSENTVRETTTNIAANLALAPSPFALRAEVPFFGGFGPYRYLPPGCTAGEGGHIWR